MVLLTCEALVRQAILILDSSGEGASPAACHLQAALDALNPFEEEMDIDAVADALLGGPEQRVRTFAIG